jgi:hypothetical protein
MSIKISRYCLTDESKKCLAYEADLHSQKCQGCLRDQGVKEIHFVIN